MKTKKQTRTVSARLNPTEYIELRELAEAMDMDNTAVLRAGIQQLKEKRNLDVMEYRLMSFFHELTINSMEFDETELSNLRILLNNHIKKIGGAA